MIYVFTMPGCEACEAAEPEISAYSVKHPMAMVLRVRADGPVAQGLGINVRATPTYLYIREGTDRQMIAHEGMMTTAQMEKWISKIEKAAA